MQTKKIKNKNKKTYITANINIFYRPIKFITTQKKICELLINQHRNRSES